jgi:hypothetical protein
MSGRILYSLSLKCSRCGAAGEAEMSEHDLPRPGQPAPPRGHDRHLKSISRGFVLLHSDEEGWPAFECVKCRIAITY